jgi:O-antigen ligase
MNLKKKRLWEKSKNFLFFLKKIILWLIVFLSPNQLIKHFWPSWSFVFGIRVDYLSLSISLSEILIVGLLFLWLFETLNSGGSAKRFIFSKSCFLGITFLFFVNIFFGSFSFNTLISWLRIFLLVWFFYYLVFWNKTPFFDWFFLPATLSIFFFGSIGIFHFLKGQTTNSFLYWLGERSFNLNTPGVAHFSLFGRDFLRAYSTFPHPNSLAGYFGVFFFLILSFKKNGKLIKVWRLFILLFCLTVLFLSFSKGAFIALFFSLLIFFFNKFIKLEKFSFWLVTLVFLFSFFSLFVSHYFHKNIYLKDNLRERLLLISSAKNVFLKKPFFGVGLNNFILETSDTFNFKNINYQLQPVHNIYILVLTELGLFGFFLFYIFLVKVFKIVSYVRKTWFFLALTFVIISGVADHYWLTLNQNRLALVFLLAAIFKDYNGKPNSHC